MHMPGMHMCMPDLVQRRVARDGHKGDERPHPNRGRLAVCVAREYDGEEGREDAEKRRDRLRVLEGDRDVLNLSRLPLDAGRWAAA